MRVECIHGYFKFQEISSGELSRFSSLFGLDLARSGDHFTFADLVEAPNYSLVGGTFLETPTTATFEGNPWDVMRENGLIYNFSSGLVVPILSIVQPVKVSDAGNFFVSTGMLMPGSVTEDGSRVTDYSAAFQFDRLNFKYSEISYA